MCVCVFLLAVSLSEERTEVVDPTQWRILLLSLTQLESEVVEFRNYDGRSLTKLAAFGREKRFSS